MQKKNFVPLSVFYGVILMRKIVLFAEDYGHETFIGALIKRLAAESDIKVNIVPRSVRGGHGKVITEYRSYLDDLRCEKDQLPDLLIAATDANCKGCAERSREIEDASKEYQSFTVCAIPDPHIERWLLLDSAAFKTVVGKGCHTPDQKCSRGRYKKLLMEAMQDAGVNPPLGGMEYAEDIVNVMDLQRIDDKSFERFCKELQSKFKAWV